MIKIGDEVVYKKTDNDVRLCRKCRHANDDGTLCYLYVHASGGPATTFLIRKSLDACGPDGRDWEPLDGPAKHVEIKQSVTDDDYIRETTGQEAPNKETES
jgi:hypothetical protein